MCQIIRVAKSSIMFENNTFHVDFIQNTGFIKDFVTMPIAKYEHFILIVLNLRKKEIILFDALDNEISQKTMYFPKFLNFMKLQIMNNSGWKFFTQRHCLQMDNFSCGIFIIHLFLTYLKDKNRQMNL